MNRNEACQVFLDFPSHSSRMVGLAVLATLLMIVVAPGVAQIPDKFENLKVLPKDMTKPELMDIMKGFSSALDVRCVNCHVGDEEKGFSSFDFQSDEKALKEKARVMMRMVKVINNEHLSELGKPAEKLVKVECVTCHRGQSRPQLIGDALMRGFESGGVDTLIATYRKLRERHFGSHTFDFSEPVLLKSGDALLSLGEVASALRVLKLNLEFFPESARTFFQLGMAHRTAGDKDNALKNLEKALELMPGNPFLTRQIEELKKQ